MKPERTPEDVAFRKKADKKWSRKAEWIIGYGRYALLAHCGVLTVTCHKTIEKAMASKNQIDEYCCGGKCYGDHEIIDLGGPVK